MNKPLLNKSPIIMEEHDIKEMLDAIVQYYKQPQRNYTFMDIMYEVESIIQQELRDHYDSDY